MRRHKHERKSPRDGIELPIEILELIFLKFTNHVDLFSCTRVNSHWRHATQDLRLWKVRNSAKLSQKLSEYYTRLYKVLILIFQIIILDRSSQNCSQSIYAHMIYPLSIPKRKKKFDWYTAVREYIVMRNNIKLGRYVPIRSSLFVTHVIIRCVTKSICTRTLDDSINSISLNERWAVVNR